jgi:hypothetical protein
MFGGHLRHPGWSWKVLEGADEEEVMIINVVKIAEGNCPHASRTRKNY